MGGEIVFLPESAHRCDIDEPAEAFPLGTIWQCFDCEKRWVVVGGQGEDGRGYEAWRPMTERNKDGDDR